MRQYKHIFFDLDHTLWDFDKNAAAALQDIFAIYDLQPSIDDSFDAFYEKYLYHNGKLWARYQKGFINAEELKWRRMWRTLLDFKIADEPLAKKLSNSFLDILPTKEIVFPHTHEILTYLTDKDYQLHLITNGFEITQQKKLKHSGLDKYFNKVITSETSNSMKPRKEIFDYALAATDATLRESIMIGDNLDADILGALNAGMDCIFVNHIDAHCNLDPTYIVTHLKEIETIL